MPHNLDMKTKSKKPVKAMSGADVKPLPVQMGRPSIYTEDMATELFARLSAGQSLHKICRDDHMPAFMTVFNWINAKPDFLDRYEQAKGKGCEAMAEEMMQIADDDTVDVQRSRLMVDTRKWYLSKIKAKKYGEKLDTTVTHKFSSMADDELDARIIELENQTPE
jgi:hypothetical protein